MKQIGSFSPSVINTLNLDIIPNTPIMIGETNIEHIKKRHPYEYDKYFHDIQHILKSPDYIGINPNDKSILFVKEFSVDKEYIRVAVKVTSSGKHYVKTLHLLSTCNAERYIGKGSLIPLTDSTKHV